MSRAHLLALTLRVSVVVTTATQQVQDKTRTLATRADRKDEENSRAQRSTAAGAKAKKHLRYAGNSARPTIVHPELANPTTAWLMVWLYVSREAGQGPPSQFEC